MAITRRGWLGSAALAASGWFPGQPRAADSTGFQFRYLLASCLYGYTSLDAILPQVKQVGATAIDLWPKVHGNQREQVSQLGEPAFRAMLEREDVSLGCLTQYKLGPFGLRDELEFARRFGCQTIVTGAVGPRNLKGTEQKAAIKTFCESMKPHVEAAAAAGVTIAIENHGHNLIDSVDALRYLRDLRPSKRLAVALAPYHLPQDARQLAALIRDLDSAIEVFYAWQHGMGCMKKLPKEQELLQLPGRGELDFRPLVKALQSVNYRGWTEIFMHPVPRGVPMLPTTAAITQEVNHARDYLARCLDA